MEIQIWLYLISYCTDILGGNPHLPGCHILPGKNLLAKTGNTNNVMITCYIIVLQSYPDGTSEDLNVRSRFFFSNPQRYESVEGDSFPYQRSV